MQPSFKKLVFSVIAGVLGILIGTFVFKSVLLVLILGAAGFIFTGGIAHTRNFLRGY